MPPRASTAREPVRRLNASLPGAIDRYQLVRPLGQGGMAKVFHARLQSIGGFERDVAVKVLLPEFASDTDFIDMLLDEARIAGAIRHPNVVGVLDVGRHEELFYLVMEYVEGVDLRSILRASPGGRLPVGTALYLVSEVLRGLGAVHNAVDASGTPRKIVHRDVSPANVLVDRAGLVKLGDFGIAHASSRLSRTRPGAVKGKLRYMAPEQLVGQPVDHRADLYAVAIVLCELLLGTDGCEPRRMTPFGSVFAWSRREAPSVPSDVADVIDRATTERPGDRYPDAAAFRRDVLTALHRRHPGYGADELARELARLNATRAPRGEEHTDMQGATTTPHDLFDVSDGQALFEEEQKPTDRVRVQPRRPLQAVPQAAPPPPAPVAAPPVAPPVMAQPLEPVMPSAPTVPMPKVARLRGVLDGHGKLAWVAGTGVVLSVLVVLIAVAVGRSAPSTAAVAPSAQAAPYVRPLGPPMVTTGRLTVAGPAGAQVVIGSTVYPPAPCAVELPAGEYAVRIKRPGKGRGVVRHVVIEAGKQVAIRL